MHPNHLLILLTLSNITPTVPLLPTAPMVQIRAQDWVNQGYEFLNRGRYAEAMSAFERATQLNPNYAEAWNGMGVTLNALERYQDALGALNRALEINRGYAIAWNNRGYALNGLKRYAEALPALQRALELDPNLSEAWSNMGKSLNGLKQYREAIVALQRAIQNNPEDIVAWDNLGFALLNLNRHAEAESAYERVTRLAPNSPIAWSNRGAALAAMQRYGEALSAHERSIQLDANYAEGWNSISFVLTLSKGDLQRARSAAERAIALDNNNPRFHYRLGYVLDELGEYDQALAAYQTALDRLGKNAEWESVIWHARGITLLKKRDRRSNEEAIKSFGRAINLNRYTYFREREGDANLADSWYGKCLAQYRLRNNQEALRSCNRALAVRPNFPEARRLRDEVQRRAR